MREVRCELFGERELQGELLVERENHLELVKEVIGVFVHL
jgi:hypothetical protein